LVAVLDLAEPIGQIVAVLGQVAAVDGPSDPSVQRVVGVLQDGREPAVGLRLADQPIDAVIGVLDEIEIIESGE